MQNAAQYGFSSKHLCTRPRQGPSTRTGTPLTNTTNATVSSDVAAELAEAEARKAVDRLEQQVRDALFARTTAHLAEHRILKNAFTKFDKDSSGFVDLKEFSLALEHLGLHMADHGLPGQGGLQPWVVERLFARYDADGSGALEYTEFCGAMLSPDKMTKML